MVNPWVIKACRDKELDTNDNNNDNSNKDNLARAVLVCQVSIHTQNLLRIYPFRTR